MKSEPPPESIGARRAIAAAVAMGVFVVAGVVWLLGESDRPAGTVEATSPPLVVDRPVVALAPASVATAADAEVRVESPGEMQMCGGAWVKLKDDGDVDWDSVGSATKESVDALSASVLVAMASSADEQARGVALMISMPSLTLARVKPSACEGDVACERDLASTKKQITEQRDALARLAQDSNDPTLYGWAVRACTVAPKESSGHCQVIHPAQWARLDPTNAVPWLAVAARAQAEKDAAALNDALYRISVAERYDPEEYKLGSILLDHAPDAEVNLWGTWNLVFQGIGLGGLQGFDAGALLAPCAAKELVADDVRRDVCERGAEMLVKDSTTLNGLLIGRAIGKQVGWPEARIDRLQKEGSSLQDAWTRQTPAGAASLGCAAIRGQLDRIREFAAQGQVAALRGRVMKESARTLASTSVRGVSPSTSLSR